MDNIKDIIEDLLKLYINAIDSYNTKIIQTINEKYTIIDKSICSMYLYIKILDELKIEDSKSKQVLVNYIVKQTIYGETGNICLEIPDKLKENTYKNVIDNLIIEKFEYKNRVQKYLKYKYELIENNRYIELLDFCEEISEYCIIEKLSKNGSQDAKEYTNRIIEKFIKEEISLAHSEDCINKEKHNILVNIIQEKFEQTEYKQLLNVALNLRDVYRYSTLTTTIPENVLFHQYIIAIASIVFSEYLNKELNEEIDLYEIAYKSLFHDFGEYTGNEIVTQVKNYNDDTQKMFKEIELADQENLKSMIGENLYKVISNCDEEKEGYISEILDKILGIMKLLIEVEYMNNLTYIKSICSIFQARFKKFKNEDRIANIKNREFLIDVLRESYIYIKENMMNKNESIFLKYFTQTEKETFEDEIRKLRADKTVFLA